MRYSLFFLLLFVCASHADGWFESKYSKGWLKPKFIDPVKCENHTFRDESKGFKIEYLIDKATFDGKVPEIMDVFVSGPQPTHINGTIDDEEGILVFAGQGSWHIIENMDNDEITLVLYFDDLEEIKKWKDIRLKVIGRYMNEEQRNRTLFAREVMNIRGIVGVGGGKDGVKTDFSIQIADCMPNIRGIVKKVHVTAKKYGFTISEIRLQPKYEYLLDKENNGQ